jgi:hypothetical protein
MHEEPTPVAAPAPGRSVLPTAKHEVFLTTVLNGKTVNFPLPIRLTSEELIELIADLNNKGA